MTFYAFITNRLHAPEGEGISHPNVFQKGLNSFWQKSCHSALIFGPIYEEPLQKNWSLSGVMTTSKLLFFHSSKSSVFCEWGLLSQDLKYLVNLITISLTRQF